MEPYLTGGTRQTHEWSFAAPASLSREVSALLPAARLSYGQCRPFPSGCSRKDGIFPCIREVLPSCLAAKLLPAVVRQSPPVRQDVRISRIQEISPSFQTHPEGKGWQCPSERAWPEGKAQRLPRGGMRARRSFTHTFAVRGSHVPSGKAQKLFFYKYSEEICKYIKRPKCYNPGKSGGRSCKWRVM